MDEASAAAYGLFGRDDALDLVTGVLTHGGSALVVGDPGMGKSSLLKVADQLAQRRGRRVLAVAPTQFEQGLPFAGLAELVSHGSDGADQNLPDPQRRALAVALQREDPDGRELDPLAVPLAVQGLLRQLCANEPVTLVIDDLQWLDQATVGSLAFALRRLSVEPDRLSVLLGARPDPAGAADLIRALPEPHHALELPPLEDWAIGQVLRSRIGPRWTPPLATGVARASSGNPFLALMIAQATQSDVSRWSWSAHDGHEPIFPVPPSLVGLLGEKVSLLPWEARDVLLLVSAAGRLTVAQLREVFDDVRIRSALESAADWDIANVGAGSVVTFTHPMLASGIYDAATPVERRRAHRVLAELLDDPVERARHRSRSTTAPDEAVAGELAHAAEVSLGRGARELAGELWKAAALATPSTDDSAGGLGRWLRAVDAYLGAGDQLAARAALHQASGLAADSEQQAQLLIRRVRLDSDDSWSRSRAEQAFRLAPRDCEIRIEILQLLGTIHRMQGSGRLAWRLTQYAVAEAAAAKRSDLQLAALSERLSIEHLWGLGQREQTLQELERLVDADLNLHSADLPWTKGFFADWNDETAERHVRDGIRAAVDAGRYGDLAALYIALVMVLVRASRVRDAHAALDEADRSGAWTTVDGLQESMARVLVTAYAGQLDLAREIAERAASHPLSRRSPYWRGGFLAQLGLIETSARNWQAALDALRELARIVATTKIVDLEQLLWGVHYADAALQVGSLDEVETAIDVLRRQGASGRPEANVAADRCAALLRAARGEVDEAVRALRSIVDLEGAECPFEAARSRLALGQVYRRAGYKRLASDVLAQAAATFEELGIPRWAERARDEAGRVGLHPTASALTATERRVAELVASGSSNQEAAAELFLSVKTVEANLTRIYRKLSVRSRTELANHLNAE